ncbi:MAG TPA: hypothetical protein DEP05_08110 [Betaproteobacteria bacterium]|nr:hypothetical protein [Betaproteobacteria bacterium]
MLKEMFPEVPIDPLGPLVITYPKMHLWQFAYILSAASGRELYFPASRAFNEAPAFHKVASTYADVLKEFGLERPAD